MPSLERITTDPNIMGGQPCVRGMRIPVSLILNLLANGNKWEEILTEYPDLEMEDIAQAFEFAEKNYDNPEDDIGRLSSN